MSLTPYPSLRLKLTPTPTLKLQFLPAIPGTNAAAAAAAAAASAAAAAASAAAAELAAAGVDEIVVALADGATVPLNSAAGSVFHLSTVGDRTILVPTNAPAAGRTHRMIIRHEAVGGARTLTLTTGVAGAFRFGTTIVGLTATLSGKTDYIGFIYDQPDNRWDVVSYSKGF